MAHSKYSPSSWPRARRCPGSVKASENYPNTSNVFADEGTAAHFIGELCLTNACNVDRYAACIVAVPPHDVDDECFFVSEKKPAPDGWRTFEVGDEMVYEVQRYVDWCAELPGDHFTEVRVDVSDLTPRLDQQGTSDHIACSIGVLTVTDLKYGKGVPVFAFENEQAIGYAYGARKEFDWLYDFKVIRIRICQPRLNVFDVWEVPIDEFLQYCEAIKGDLAKAELPNPPFAASEKACKFCLHAPYCVTLRDTLDEQRALAFEDLDLSPANDIPSLSMTDLVYAWHLGPLLKIRMEAITKELFRLMEMGEQVPTLKLVNSKTNRIWRDERQAESFLIEHGIPKTALYSKPRFAASPAEAEKLLKDTVRGRKKEDRERRKALLEAFNQHTDKPQGGPTIAPETDPRPNYEPKGASVFKDLDEVVDDGLE